MSLIVDEILSRLGITDEKMLIYRTADAVMSREPDDNQYCLMCLSARKGYVPGNVVVVHRRVARVLKKAVIADLEWLPCLHMVSLVNVAENPGKLVARARVYKARREWRASKGLGPKGRAKRP